MVNAVEQSVIQVMKERGSVRKYQPGVEIPPATLKTIIEAAGSAPSAWNLQHWKFVVIQNQDNKNRILPAAYNQQQVADASAVIIVLGDMEANKNAEAVYDEMVRSGAMTEDVVNNMVNDINNYYENVATAGVHDAIRNASFAAMQLMLAAKAHGIDTCPIGGFSADALREELNIPERFIPVVMVAIGYAEQPAYATNRFSADQIVINERF